MSDHDDGDDDASEATSAGNETPGYWTVTEALEQSGFTVPQLRSLVGAGLVRTERARRGGQLLYSADDLRRLEGAARVEVPDQEPLAAAIASISNGYRSMLELALKQTKQAQDHERLLISTFAKPLEQLGEGSKSLVTAVLDQNRQLVQRASDGDAARLDFVKAAESMLRDQRTELREQVELDRKHELRQQVWNGVKEAAPHLLKGLQATTGADRLEAAVKLKAKLDPAKVAALIHYKLLGDEEIDLLCTALELDRAAIEALNTDADAAPAEPEAALDRAAIEALNTDADAAPAEPEAAQ